MSHRSFENFHDEVIRPGEAEGLPERFFDRFVFNLHPTDVTSPSVLFGLGLHPVRDTVDGFAIISTATEQRNVRYSTELSATEPGTCGPFSFEVVEPNRIWRAALSENPTGMTFDLTWEARAPAWWGDIDVTNDSGETTSFSHLFQSGWASGVLSVDGEEQQVERWYSQRDRSRGVRTMAGGQGLHIWYQAQFEDRSVGFLLVESRTGERILLEGAVMHTDGGLDEIVDVRHDLVFDDQLDLRSGRVQVTTESGVVYPIDTDATAGGGLMAGGGYGGHHGKALGRDHVEGEVYPLDGSVTQRTLDSSLTDRLCSFDWDGQPGSGIFEFALTRSSSYTYTPTLV
ncbi:hypothetical protein ASE01_13975 [Nocardioides sp. Root190]|uniref:DUF7064 domain-containing protein n=1 Tax=Nocardioides sp. Root190 TaxID=1736488 RepID=UPI0006FDE7E4|nr:hypothetical protein [Nocardioides sp. Root190]KRB76130.1 hypothetical protein ASE01_13975 [Nocardioides sp. Root190]